MIDRESREPHGQKRIGGKDGLEERMIPRGTRGKEPRASSVHRFDGAARPREGGGGERPLSCERESTRPRHARLSARVRPLSRASSPPHPPLSLSPPPPRSPSLAALRPGKAALSCPAGPRWRSSRRTCPPPRRRGSRRPCRSPAGWAACSEGGRLPPGPSPPLPRPPPRRRRRPPDRPRPVSWSA